ncbi:hypothetical protein ACWDYH_33290 [Nocardia goodfellowii]|uniref:PIN domain-containing protein n=1 Tax=Nocardia goodfellowii TaxID=882446 RepID=A0ABS4QGD0_9NOCA|nr:hypothetical protein [Nocardia goodfellowii]MBP2190759.1 hypothetical protein [Nocardia goodfellowii]
MTDRSELSGVVFDTAALTAWAHRVMYAQSVVWTTSEAGNTLLVPVTALIAARALIPVRRHDILSALLDLPNTVIRGLDGPASRQVGATLLGRRDADTMVTAGHVTLEAVNRGWSCLTDRPDKLRELDPRVIVDVLP